MKKIIRLTERDLTNIVRRVIREQGPFAPGMGPKTTTTTPIGVNPTNKSSLKYTGEFATAVADEEKVKEFNRFVYSQSGGHQGLIWNFVPISYKTARVNDTRLDPLSGYMDMDISKKDLPKDIKTNPCYSNLKLDDEGGIYQLDVKMSCKKEYQNLAYMQ